MKSKVAWSAESRQAVAEFEAAMAGLRSLMDDGGDRPDPLPAGSAGPESGDPLRDLADDCLDGLGLVAGLEPRLAALKVRFVAEFVGADRAVRAPGMRHDMAAEMAVVSEVACVLTVAERSASALLVEAESLTTSLPLTLAALEAGTVSWQHARIMVDETTGLDAEGAAGLEAHFLDPDVADAARGCPAGELVPGRFRAKARTWRERHHPVSIEERHARCSKDRRVEFLPDRDGMAWINAYLPAVTASAVWDRTTAAARALQGPAETRTLAQLRADIATTLLLDTSPATAPDHGPGTGTGTIDHTGTGTGAGAGAGAGSAGRSGGGLWGEVPVPRAQVLVTVPVMALLGVTEEPAFLDGYGPIPPSMARQLVADGAGSFYRVLTDPRDGAPLEIGRSSYRLTKTQRQWLRMRDGKCPFPGCNNASLDNEADHLLAWAEGGTTGISNLGQPCRRHHRLKHTTGWAPTPATKDHPPGWISPAGRHYRSEEQDWEPPRWPRILEPGEDSEPRNPVPRNPVPRKLVPQESGWKPPRLLENLEPVWEPPQCRESLEPDWDPVVEPPPDPFPFGDPHADLPVDPFPDWYLFTDAIRWPTAEADALGSDTPPRRNDTWGRSNCECVFSW